MKKLLLKKSKGYVVTIEMIAALLIWTALMSATVYVVNTQKWQKMMYTSFCSASMQTARWGGSKTNVMVANGKTTDIAASMEDNIRRASGRDVDITITPEKIDNSNKTIKVNLTWRQPDNLWAVIGFGSGNSGRDITIEGSFDAFMKPGRLLG